MTSTWLLLKNVLLFAEALFIWDTKALPGFGPSFSVTVAKGFEGID